MFVKKEFFRFALLRFFRIYPLHLAILFFLFLFLFVFPPYLECIIREEPERFTVGNILANILLVDNWGIVFFGHPWNGVSWTISLEILAYIAFPFLAFFVNRIFSVRLCLVLVIGVLLGLGLFMLVTNNLDNNLKWRGGILRIACEFSCGVILSRAYRLGFSSSFPWFGVGCLGLLVLCFIIPFMRPLIYLWLAGFMMSLTFENDKIARIFESKFISWLGEISYSLYLTHMLLLQGIFWLVSPSMQLMNLQSKMVLSSLIIFFILLFAWFVNIYVERPSRNIGRVVVKHLT